KRAISPCMRAASSKRYGTCTGRKRWCARFPIRPPQFPATDLRPMVAETEATMREIYLGDSYDLVKRFWAESLRLVAPLFAHPRFVPAGIRPQYTAVTSIHVCAANKLPEGPFGLLLDPNTGIPLPAESSTEASASHAPLPFIVQVNASMRPA